MRASPRLFALAFAALVLLVHAAAFGSYVADDAAISLTYASHLVHAAGLTLNPGDAPVEAYSNPLWVALLAPGAMLGGAAHPEWLLKILGLACALATLAAAQRLSQRVHDRDGATGVWIAPLLLATSTPFAFWAVAGLENPLYALLLTAAAAAYLNERNPARSGAMSAMLLVLLALTRPEGIAFAGAFLVHRLVTRDSLRKTASWTAMIVLPMAVFFAWRHWYFDAWLPNTFYAKVDARHLSRLGAYIVASDDPGHEYIASFVLRFAVLLSFAAIGLLDRRAWRASLLFAGLVATDVLFVLYAGGDWWPAFRFMTVVLPIAAVAAAHGIAMVARATSIIPARTALAASAVGICMLPNARVLGDLWRVEPQALISLRSRLDLAERIETFAALAHVKDPVVLEPDIGGTSLAGGLRIVDLAMLADVHLARFRYYAPFFRQYVFEERRPDFIHTHSVWSRASRLASYPELRRDYLPVFERRESDQLAGLFVRKDHFVRAATAEDAPLSRFGEIDLVAVDPPHDDGVAGGRLTFTWEWRCPERCTRDYGLYLRVGGTSWGFMPVFGWYASTEWMPTEVIRATRDVVLPAALSAGTYDIEIAAAAAGDTPNYVRVGSVRIEAATRFRLKAEATGESGVTSAFRRNPDDSLRDAEQATQRHDYAAAFAILRGARAADPSDARILHRLEDARERAWWIDYYADTRQLDRLERTYRDEAAAHALPADRALLDKLYFALLPVVDRAALPALRRDTGRVTREVPFVEDGAPVVDLLDYRVDRGEWGVENRLVLYFDVRRAPARDYQIWIHAYPADADRRVTDMIVPSTPTHAWQAGRHIESRTFHLQPGDYDLRVGFWQPSGPARMCPNGRTDSCYLLLGTHRLVP